MKSFASSFLFFMIPFVSCFHNPARASLNSNEFTLGGTKLVAITEAPSSSANTQLLYFWATWCPTCEEKLKKTLPEFQKKHSNVAITTISMDTELDRIKGFIEKKKIALPVYFDPSEKIRKSLKIVAVPYWIVLKRENDKAEWKQTASQPVFDIDKVETAIK